jgi:hypothetical protein
LAYLVTSVVLPLLNNLIKLFKEVNDINLSCLHTTDENVSGERVELHGGDFVLRVDGEERVHLVLTVPERYFVDGSAPYVLDLLFIHLAVGLRN